MQPELKKCNKCGEEKPATEANFQLRRYSIKDSFLSECKACMKAYRAAYYAIPENRERIRASGRRSRSRWTLRRYGLCLNDYNEILASQGGVCLICKEPPKARRLYVDHDHVTGQIRGLLHGTCNSAIGLLRDDPLLLEAAAKYLRDSKTSLRIVKIA